MPLLSTSPCNIIQFHRISRWPARHDVSFRPTLINIVNCHGVADKLWRGGCANLHIRNPVCGIQRVIALSLGLELDDLRLSTWKVLSPQISLIFNQTDMQSAWTRPIYIPVRIRELWLVHLLGAMQLWYST